MSVNNNVGDLIMCKRISDLAKNLNTLRSRIPTPPPHGGCDTGGSPPPVQTRPIADLLNDASAATLRAQAQTIAIAHLLRNIAPTRDNYQIAVKVGKLLESTTTCVTLTDTLKDRYHHHHHDTRSHDLIMKAADSVTSAYDEADDYCDQDPFYPQFVDLASSLAEAICPLHDALIAVRAHALTYSFRELGMKAFIIGTQATAHELSLVNLLRDAARRESDKFVALVKDYSRVALRCIKLIDDAVLAAKAHDLNPQRHPVCDKLVHELFLDAEGVIGASIFILDASEARGDDVAFSRHAADLGSILAEAGGVLFDLFIAVQSQVPVAPGVYPWKV